MSRFARGAEHTIHSTSEKVWITPLLGEEVATVGEADAPDMTAQAVVYRHTFRITDHAAAEFESPEDVLKELDWMQLDSLSAAIMEISNLGKELAKAQATFRDGERPPEGVEPSPDGAPLQPEAE